jgi:hypothetical protein
MKWIAISGSWRKSTPELEQDIHKAVAELMERGDGLITGGALGTDYIAVAEALRHNPAADRIKVILPTALTQYAAHYRKRAREGVITAEQAEMLISLLEDIKRRRSRSLTEMTHTTVNEQTYYDRNTEVLEGADELLAFQVDNSRGTQDAIDKAHQRELPVRLKRYSTRS